MTRSTIAKTFTLAAGIALALGTVSTAKADDKGCSNLSLRGTFAYTNAGNLVAAPAPIGPYAEVGTQTFDGRGGTTTASMVSLIGTILQGTSKGTYTVNPDCTGTFTLVDSASGITSHFFFALADGGAEFHALCLDSVAVITRIARRQFPLGDWRG